MVQVSYPGVYIEELSSGVHTITGVATSIAAFFGRASQGPMNTAVRLSSLTDYTRTFGAPFPLSDLAISVQQFFANGGTDCYVVRLAANPSTAGLTLKNLAATRDVLTVTAKSPGLWGNGIRLEIDYNTANPDESFNVRIYQVAANVIVKTETFNALVMDPQSPRFAPTFLTQSSTLVDVDLNAALGDIAVSTSPIYVESPAGYSESRRVLDVSAAHIVATRATLTTLFQGTGHFQIAVDDSVFVDVDLSALDFTGMSAAAIATAITTEINSKLAGVLPGASITCSLDTVGPNLRVLRLTSAGARTASVRIRRASALDMANALMLGIDQGGIEVVRFSNQRPVFIGSVYMGGPAYGDITDGPSSVNKLAAMAQDATFTVITDATSVVVPGVQTTAPGDPWYLDASGNSDGVREKLRIVVAALNADANFSLKYQASLWGYHLAISLRAQSINTTSDVTSTSGTLVGTGTIDNVRQYTLGLGGAGTYQDAPVLGTDGAVPKFADYAGVEALRTGFYALDAVDLFNLMVLPADQELLQPDFLPILGPASTYCTDHRAILLIDPPSAWTVNNLPVAQDSDVNTLRSLVTSTNSAVFYPRVQFFDGTVQRYIGPTGMIAGIMARTDASRGVWKAPAGLDATLNGSTDLEVILTDRQNGVLNPLAVNCLRSFPSGRVVWGSRTLAGFDNSADSDWKYLPVRRTALFLEESLYRGTQWVVFEPNDDPLYASIRKNLNAFMMGLFRQGAFQGSTPSDAFFVKCDDETTTQDDRNLGIVNIVVGFAPLKPAEFVVIQIQQIAGDV
ncbi:MAG: phage tail sheath family protein [Gemmatimonadaceae bacterium]